MSFDPNEFQPPGYDLETTQIRLYPQLPNFNLPRATVASRIFSPAQQSACAGILFLLLDNFNSTVPHTQEIFLRRYILENGHSDIGLILLGLLKDGMIICRNQLIQFIAKDKSLAKNSHLKSWLEQEKQTIRARHGILSSGLRLWQNPGKILQQFLKNVSAEKLLIEELKGNITQYGREKFYVYKSGRTYYYSPNPVEESLGGRCNQEGEPLTDDMGNELTDESGNFRYAIRHLEAKNGDVLADGNFDEDQEFVERLEYVPAGTKNATPATDENNTSLASKYWEVIRQDQHKPSNKQEADAINHLSDLIDKASADEIYSYIKTPAFQALIHANSFNLSNLLKTKLLDFCNKFTNGYEKINAILSDELLLHILLDEKFYATLIPSTLEQLFWHHNPRLVADVIVNFYVDMGFNYGGLNFDFLSRMLANDEEVVDIVNTKRCELKRKSLLPADSRLPGKNPLEDEKLTKFQLFQYDDKTIAAVEQWLRNSAADIIINSDCKNPGQQLANTAPYYFYQIPANSYMLLDPQVPGNTDNYRYKQFKKDLQELLHDSEAIRFGKPIIFFGIVNLDNTHYIPYFIYKNDVIAVDSSPRMYPPRNQNQSHIDTKKQNKEKLQRIFQDLIPGCRFFDPEVSQMLRERDCGPNSAQTILDALLSSKTHSPLLFVDSQEGMTIQPQYLTVKGQPHGVHPYNGMYVYPSRLEIDSNRNRSVWQERLNPIKEIVYYQRPDALVDKPLSVYDAYDLVPEQYSYNVQVISQQLNDERNNNISAIQSILLSEEEGRGISNEIVTHYKKELTMARLDRLSVYIKTKVESSQLDSYCSAHQGNLMLLLEDVATVLLKDHISDALGSTLQHQVLNNLPDRRDLDSTAILNGFLEKFQHIFKKLNPHEQIVIRDHLKNLTEKAVLLKLGQIHTVYITDILRRNCHRYLLKAPASGQIASLEDLTRSLMAQIDTENYDFFDDTESRGLSYLASKASWKRDSFIFLKNNLYTHLTSLISSAIASEVDEVKQRTIGHVISRLNFQIATLRQLLTLFNAQGYVVLPDPKLYLLDATIARTTVYSILRYQELNTILGHYLLPHVQAAICENLRENFTKEIKRHVDEFIAKTNFSNDWIPPVLSLQDQLLTADNQLTQNFDFGPYITKYGTIGTVHIEDYRNPIAYPFIQFELQTALARLLVAIRDQTFASIADALLAQNVGGLTVETFYSHFPNLDKLSVDIINRAIVTSPELSQLFVANFMQYDESHNRLIPIPCSIRFNEYLKRERCDQIISNYIAAIELAGHVAKANTLVANYINTNPNTVLKADCFLPAITSINQILLTQFDEQFKKAKEIYRAQVLMIIGWLKMDYVFGDVTPGSHTAITRPLFCGLLGITADAILTPTTAVNVDMSLQKLLRERGGECFIPQDLHTIPLFEVKTLPVSTKQPLSKELLVKIIAYWYTHRTTLTDIRYMMDQDRLPPLMKYLITITNTAYANRSSLTQENIDVLNATLRGNLASRLEFFGTSSVIEHIREVLLNTQELAGEELNETKISLTQLRLLLSGEAVRSLCAKPDARPKVTKEAFNAIVKQEYTSKLRQDPNVSLEAMQHELAKGYIVEGIEVKQITRTELNQKIGPEMMRLNRLAREEAERQNESITNKADHIKPKIYTFGEVRTLLEKEYIVIEPNALPEEDEILVSVPRERLQPSKGLFTKLAFFGETSLEKFLTKRSITHSDDKLTQRDLNQMRMELKLRWNGLKKAEGYQAAYKHYLCAKPSRQDSVYIACAQVLAQCYQKNQQTIFVYELLMPEQFVHPSKLKSKDWPESVLKLINEVPEGHALHNIDEAAGYGSDSDDKDTKETMTIDDIPLQNLVITRSGYALNIDWIVAAYAKTDLLSHPYAERELTLEEVEDIMRNPGSIALANRVRDNCTGHLTSEAIDLLEDYVIGTVFAEGYRYNYTPEQNAKKDEAAQKFTEEVAKLPRTVAAALYNETIPNNESEETVGTTIKASHQDCATGRGTSLARVVLAYKPHNHRLPAHILNNLGEHTIARIKHRTFDSGSTMVIGDNCTDLEKYILETSGLVSQGRLSSLLEY